MDFKSVSQDLLKITKNVLPTNVVSTLLNNNSVNDLSKAIYNINDSRIAPYIATSAIANGADPKLVYSKCFMTNCKDKAYFVDFKQPTNIKNYMDTGMCQTCQDEALNEN